MRVIIVATYYQRQEQFIRTLQSLQSSHKEFEVIVVDDSSPDPFIAPKTEFPLTVIRTQDKDWTDRDIPANIGFHEAIKRGADIIISQNAECYHVGDVISESLKVTDESYISFSCFSLGENVKGDINQVIKENNHIVSETGGTGWYNHPDHRPVAFDFCAAMTRNTLIKLNGFDERFSYGLGYGDDDFIRRVKELGLRVEIPINPFVVHQWHYSVGREVTSDHVQRNLGLLNMLYGEKNTKAEHIKTPDFI